METRVWKEDDSSVSLTPPFMLTIQLLFDLKILYNLNVQIAKLLWRILMNAYKHLDDIGIILFVIIT